MSFDLSIEDVAKRFGISVADAEKLISLGVLKPQKTADGRRTFARRDIVGVGQAKAPHLPKRQPKLAYKYSKK